jgi:hypothetical protein
MFGMIWFLPGQVDPVDPQRAAQLAKTNYRDGIALSAGRHGETSNRQSPR